MGETIDWRALAIYLADCHAANLELALRKNCSKGERKRLFAIMKASKQMLLGEISPRTSYMREDGMLNDVVNRLSRYVGNI